MSEECYNESLTMELGAEADPVQLKSNNIDLNLRLKDQTRTIKTKVYKRRWFILLIFVSYACFSAIQWIQYSIITNIIMRYYNVSALAVDYTSMIFMITYIPFIFPASFIMDKMGLRVTALTGSILTAIGSWIKVASVSPDRFLITFIGQTIVALSQLFSLSVPSRLAAVWFDLDQVSRACGLGVFGTQLGVAIGFVITPMIVRNHENVEDIGNDLYLLFRIIAGITTFSALAVILFFRDEPPLPPNEVQASRVGKEEYVTKDFCISMKRFFTNRGFLHLLFAYGISVGVFNAMSTLLNQTILIHFPGSEKDAGKIGLTITVTGMFGAILFGYILDKTHKFKETSLIVYLLSAFGMVGFSIALMVESKISVYIASGLMGFFMSGYIPVGFEYGAELTFPEAEATSSGILNAMTQLFGIIFTLIFGSILTNFGDFWSNVAFSAVLFIGSFITAITPTELRRQKARADVSYSQANQIIA